MNIHASLDTSVGFALAVLKDDAVVRQATLPGMGRESDRVLVPWVQTQLSEIGLSVQEITHWTLGTGPGSFAGLRCGIAMVKGMVAVTQATMRGVPSAYALAAKADSPDRKVIGVLHDGRCGQVLLSRFRRGPSGLKLAEQPFPLDPQMLMDEEYKCDFYVTVQAGNLPELPVEISSRMQLFSKLDAVALAKAPVELYPWPSDLAGMEKSTEPLYVRQAVFVNPAVLRQE